MTTTNTRAVAYIRVSTEEQAAEGHSLAAQRAKIAAYAVANDLELVGVFADEGVSGKRVDNRPALQEALTMLRSGAATALVVVKLDRLSRSTRDVLDFVEHSGREGWSFHSMGERLDTGSAAGRMIVTVLAALSQMEREQIGERTSATMQHMKRQGLRVGSVPFGSDLASDGRTLVPNAAEQAVIVEARAAVAAGRALSAIARDFNARGVKTKRGFSWTHVQVGKLLAA